MVDEITYNVAVPPGPLKVLSLDDTCCVERVLKRKDASPLLGVIKKGDTLISVNGTMVTPTTMLDVIKAAEYGTSERMLVFQRKSPRVGRKAADDGTSERKLAFGGRVKTTPALPDGPNAPGALQASRTGQTRLSTQMSGTIAQLKELKELLDGGVLTQDEFDAQKSVILQPGMMQPAIMTQPGVVSINAAGQMVDADGISLVMDGGGRVWSAPYSKIMANEVDGCYCHLGLLPVCAAAKITSEGEDTYTETGVCAFWGLWPFCIKFRRIPNTNSFRDDGCAIQKWSRDLTGQITVIDNCPTVCCMNKC